MRQISTLTCLVILLATPLAIGCASDSPRYADPPPGSHSPAAAPDERGTDDRRDDIEDQERPEEEQEDDIEPMPDIE